MGNNFFKLAFLFAASAISAGIFFIQGAELERKDREIASQRDSVRFAQVVYKDSMIEYLKREIEKQHPKPDSPEKPTVVKVYPTIKIPDITKGKDSDWKDSLYRKTGDLAVAGTKYLSSLPSRKEPDSSNSNVDSLQILKKIFNDRIQEQLAFICQETVQKKGIFPKTNLKNINSEVARWADSLLSEINRDEIQIDQFININFGKGSAAVASGSNKMIAFNPDYSFKSDIKLIGTYAKNQTSSDTLFLQLRKICHRLSKNDYQYFR